MGSRILKVLGDAVALHLAFLSAFLLRFGGTLPEFNLKSYIQVAPWITIILLVLGNVYDLYAAERRSRSEDVSAVLVVVSFVTVATAGLSFVMRGFSMPRTVLLLSAPLQVALMLGWHWLLDKCAAYFQPRQSVMVLDGADSLERVQAVVAASGAFRNSDLTAVSMVDVRGFGGLVLSTKPAVLVVGPTLSIELRQAALEYGVHSGCRIYLVPDLYEVLLHGSTRTSFGDLPALVVDWPGEEPIRRIGKRVFDLISASAGILVGAPLFAMIAAAIWFFDGRPVLYSQVRSGKGGKPFTLFKFRTMHVDAERATGPVLSLGSNDSRVTRLGRFLRRTRLDELPQLWNVLVGDMSIVGPRPERPHFVAQFEASVTGYQYRQRLKPGLTGLAQVEGRYSTCVEDKLRFDLLYARSFNFWSDLRIVLKTARTMLLGSKAS